MINWRLRLSAVRNKQGATSDHRRATVLQTTTSFGKGSVQTIIPLDAKPLRLTTAL